MPICPKCNKYFGFRIRVDNKIRNLSKRKFCLECSPFNHHNTRNINKVSPVVLGKKTCPKCKIEKNSDEFYVRRNGNDFSAYCKQCNRKEALDRIRLLKQKCIEYKNGKCENCGYNNYIGALEFHHINPDEKDFAISNLNITLFNDKIKKELDKCKLLCSNCHREEHHRILMGM